MGNTVGSTSANFCNFFDQEEDSYILGLWCADKYFWSSSVGISNSDPILIESFISFLRGYFPKERLRLRIYSPSESLEPNQKLIDKVLKQNVKFKDAKKASKIGYHLYVNSRPLLRDFREAEEKLETLKETKMIRAYFAGRFDGDGSIDDNLKTDCRIVYKDKKSAELDNELMERIGIEEKRVYNYKSAGTFCLYVYEKEAPKFIDFILPFIQKSYGS